MGSYSHCCKLSSLPITYGEPVVLIPMLPVKNLYENSEASLKKYGSTYLCSNNGTRLKFMPNMFPIKGTYNDYGGMENIVEDDNTKIIEEYYGLSIQEIVDVICSGRKDDGYDDALKPIIDDSVKYEYNKPVYQERYKELLKVSGMWVHGEFYDKLTASSSKDSDYDGLELGHKGLLESLGFKLKTTVSNGRYNLAYEKDGLTIYSDGTWISSTSGDNKNDSLYTLSEFKKYCERKGVEIDITEQDSKDRVEQIYDYEIPTYESLFTQSDLFEDLSKEELIQIFGNNYSENLEVLIEASMSRDQSYIAYLLLNGTYNQPSIKNPLTGLYFNAAKEGKLRDNIVRFWRFNSVMFSCGKYYDIVGTSPQDGDHKTVHNMLKIASDIAEKRLKEYYDGLIEDFYDEEE